MPRYLPIVLPKTFCPKAIEQSIKESMEHLDRFGADTEGPRAGGIRTAERCVAAG